MTARSNSPPMFVNVLPHPACEERHTARYSCSSSLPFGSGLHCSIKPGASNLPHQHEPSFLETTISSRSRVSLSSQSSSGSWSSMTDAEDDDDISTAFTHDDESIHLDLEGLTLSDSEMERESSEDLRSLGDKDAWPLTRSEISLDDTKLLKQPESSSGPPQLFFSDAIPSSSKHLDSENAGVVLRNTLVSHDSYFLKFGRHSGIRVFDWSYNDKDLEYAFVHCLDRHNMHTQLILPQGYNRNSRVETLPVLTCTASPHVPKFADEYVCVEYSKRWHRLGDGVRSDITLSQAQPGQSSSRLPTYQIAFTKPTYLGIRIESQLKTNLYVYREDPQENPRLDEDSIRGLELLLADHGCKRC